MEGKKIRNLLSPGFIGGMEIPNRIVMAPIGSLNASPEGHVTSRNINYYTDKAKGGTGLIVVEATYTDDILSKGEDGQLGLANNSQTPGMALLASAIHDYYGIKCALQLCHIGKQLSLMDRCESLGPSDMEELIGGVMPLEIRGMTKAEINGVVDSFGEAAWRAKIAGFDAVEVHAANGHLHNMFLTPVYNKRTDEYGGSTENRMRILLETIEAIQARCGKSFPILVRFCADDYDDDGVHLEEAVVMAKMLEEAGAAALDLVGGSLSNNLCTPTMYDELALFAPLAAGIKKAGIKIPVIVAGAINTPYLAADIIAEGKADFIGLARPLLADPDWVKKLEAGRPEDIVPCMRCGIGCIGTIEEYNASKGLRCSMNPQCNLSEYRVEAPLKEKKKVAVIGGGPAGMEAARLASLRGHDVTLFEKRKLGGTMHEANFDKDLKPDIQFILDYYLTQMKKSSVKIKNEEASAKNIIAGEYDAVIVATGASGNKLKVPGYEKNHVFSDLQVTRNPELNLGRTVIVTGGGVIAAEIAVSQAMKGKKVILTTRRGGMMGEFELASDDSAPNQVRLIALLKKYEVDINLCMTLKEITDKGIISTDDEGNLREFEGDSVVVCAGYTPNLVLFDELKNNVKKIYKIGDCVKARLIGDAVNEGWLVANQI